MTAEDKGEQRAFVNQDFVLDCGCTRSVWHAIVSDRTSCPRHSEYLGPHAEDGLPVYLTDRTVVALAPPQSASQQAPS